MFSYKTSDLVFQSTIYPKAFIFFFAIALKKAIISHFEPKKKIDLIDLT